jgi:hypothetical protein
MKAGVGLSPEFPAPVRRQIFATDSAEWPVA